MNICTKPECQSSAGCKCQWPVIQTAIQPRHSMPVNLPVPIYGLYTIAVMDHNGGVTIEVDKGRPAQVRSHR